MKEKEKFSPPNVWYKYLHAAKRAIQYLKATPRQGIFFPIDVELQIKGFAKPY